MKRLIAVLALGCSDGGDAKPVDVGPDGPFVPIGQTAQPDGRPDSGAVDAASADAKTPTGDAQIARLDGQVGSTDAAVPPDAASPPPEPLQIRFQPIEQDSQALRITDLIFLPDPVGDFLVLDKDGYVIHMRQQLAGAVRVGGFYLEDTWIDTDAGLISVAIDPDFATNRFFYLGRSTSIERNVIERYTWMPDDLAATKASARLVIEVIGSRSPRSWHNVGSIGFTAEGYLWGLFGDKVLDDRAQDVDTPLGSLVRIIPDRTEGGEGYTVPPDNPYADGSGHPAIYAKGMRSPWKGVHHDGIWYWGDVGLNTFEELNRITAPGQNFGWPAAEGPCEEDCEGLTDPWLHYGRRGHPWIAEDPDAGPSGKRAIWLGCIYEPNESDPYAGRWNDVLVFGDGYPGFVRAVDINSGESWNAGHVSMPTVLRQGPDGFVYGGGLGTWPATESPETPASIYRIELD